MYWAVRRLPVLCPWFGERWTNRWARTVVLLEMVVLGGVVGWGDACEALC